MAALRAKQLRRGARPRFDDDEPPLPHKPERVAMEEVRRGLVYYDVPDAETGTPEERRMNAATSCQIGARRAAGPGVEHASSCSSLFIGFCVVVGFTKTEENAPATRAVVKSLDERVSHQPMVYLPPTAPRGPADQLEGAGTPRSCSQRRSPETAVRSHGSLQPLTPRSPAASAARD